MPGGTLDLAGPRNCPRKGGGLARRRRLGEVHAAEEGSEAGAATYTWRWGDGAPPPAWSTTDSPTSIDGVGCLSV